MPSECSSDIKYENVRSKILSSEYLDIMQTLRSAGELTRGDLFAATACAGSGNTQIPWMNIDRLGGEALPRATGTKCRKMSAPLARSNSIAPYLIFCSKLVYLFRVPLRQSEKTGSGSTVPFANFGRLHIWAPPCLLKVSSDSAASLSRTSY